MKIGYYNWGPRSKFKFKFFYRKGFLGVFIGQVDIYAKLW